MVFIVLLRCLITSRGGIKIAFDYLIIFLFGVLFFFFTSLIWNNIIGRGRTGGGMLGSPVIPARHTVALWTAITGARWQAADEVLPSSSIWLSGKRNRRPHQSRWSCPWLPSRGEAADGLSGLLCPHLNYVFFRHMALSVHKPLYCWWSPLSHAPPRTALWSNIQNVYFPLPTPKAPQKPQLTRTQKEEQKGCSCEFKAISPNVVLAKTCPTFSRSCVFMNSWLINRFFWLLSSLV